MTVSRIAKQKLIVPAAVSFSSSALVFVWLLRNSPNAELENFGWCFLWGFVVAHVIYLGQMLALKRLLQLDPAFEELWVLPAGKEIYVRSIKFQHLAIWLLPPGLSCLVYTLIHFEQSIWMGFPFSPFVHFIAPISCAEAWFSFELFKSLSEVGFTEVGLSERVARGSMLILFIGGLIVAPFWLGIYSYWFV